MKTQPISLASIGFAAAIGVVAAGEIHAADAYPTKPLRFVVPFPPGGGTDILARLIGERLGERLGTPVVIDNRPGAGTTIGTEIVTRAVPDGHTILMGSTGLSSNPALYKNLRFDALRDLQPISLVAIAPSILVIHPSVQARTPHEMVALLKAQPKRLNFASFGNGSGSHLAAELFMMVTNTSMVHVPYKGGGPGITALLGGEVQFVFASTLPTLPHIKSGRIVAIGLASSKRAQALPNVTTFKEVGIAFETGTWFGVAVPAKTPEAIVKRLHTEVDGILRLDEVKTRVLAEGADIVGGTPAQFASFIATETKRWAEVVKKADIRME